MPRVYLPLIIWHSKGEKVADRVYSIDWQPGTHRLVTSGADEFIHIWQIDRKHTEGWKPRCLSRLLGHEQEINCVRWSPNGSVLASGGADKVVLLWKQSAKPDSVPLGYEGCLAGMSEYWSRTSFFRCSDSVNTVAWCPRGLHLAVGLEDSNVLILFLNDGPGGSNLVKLCGLEGHGNMVQGISWDPLDELIATQSCDQTVRIWKKKSDGKHWKLENVIKNFKDLPDDKDDPSHSNGNQETTKYGPFSSMNGNELQLQTPLERHKQNRNLFYPEAVLPSFFRRLDWSPDGTMLVCPAGLQNVQLEDDASSTVQQTPQKSIPQSFFSSFTTQLPPSMQEWGDNSNNFSRNIIESPAQESAPNLSPSSISSVSPASYVFHRRLFQTSIPFVTHRSFVGAPVVTRVNPIAFYPQPKKPESDALTTNLAGNSDSKTIAISRGGIAESSSWLFDTRDIASRITLTDDANLSALPGKNSPWSPMCLSSENEFSTESTLLRQPSFLLGGPSPRAMNEHGSLKGNMKRKAESPLKPVELTHKGLKDMRSTPLEGGSMVEKTLQAHSPPGINRSYVVEREIGFNPFKEESFRAAEVSPHLNSATPGYGKVDSPNEQASPLQRHANSTGSGSISSQSSQFESFNDPSDDFKLRASSMRGASLIPINSTLKKELNPIDCQREPFSSSDEMQAVEIGDKSLQSEHERIESSLASSPEVFNDEENSREVPNGTSFNFTQFYSLEENKFGSSGTRTSSPVFPANDMENPMLEPPASGITSSFVYPKFVYAIGTIGGNIIIHDTQFFSPLAILKNLHFGPITDISWSDDGLSLAAASSDGLITFIFFERHELGARLLSSGWFAKSCANSSEPVWSEVGGENDEIAAHSQLRSLKLPPIEPENKEVISTSKKDGVIKRHLTIDGVFVVGNAAGDVKK